MVRATKHFHSTASSVTSGSTTWGGGVMGEPLKDQQFRDIEGRIPPPITEEEENQILHGVERMRKSQNENAGSSTRPNVENQVNEDYGSDSDIEDDLSKKLEELSIAKFKDRDYSNAEGFFLRIVDRNVKEADSRRDVTFVRVRLACLYCFQDRRADAEEIVLPL
jgi:hypothetical protein